MKPLRHLTFLLAVALAFLPAVACAAEAAQLYVATNGNDAWSGRLAAPNAGKSDGPFATLGRARDEVRKLRDAGQLSAGATVLVRAGSYGLEKPLELTRDDSGTAQAPIVYRAFEKEQVTLVGGREVTGFAPYANSKTVVQCSVKAWEIERLAPVSADRYAGDVPGCELFFDGQRMDLARWPNRIAGDPYGGEWTYVASVPERGGKTAFTYYGDRPKNWSRADEAQVHIFPGPNGFDQCVGVKSVDAAKRTLTLACETDHELQAARRYYVRNVPEELDAPGEWYLDRRTSTLYFHPPKPVASGKAFLSLLDQAVSLTEASHVTLRGFTIECCRGSAIVISGGTSNLVAKCTIRNTGLHGVEITGGTGHAVVGCDIYDTARGGIVLGGGDRYQLTPAGHYAENNHIHHCGRVLRCFEPAIRLDGVGCRASNNLIHDLPHLAVALGGNDHVIEFNEIHHVCQETADSGAFQTGGDWTFRGNVIRHNSFHDIYGYGLAMVGRGGAPQYAAPHTAHGVLLGDGASGFRVFGNLFYRVAGSMVRIVSGRDNVIQNNVFVDGQPAISTEPCADDYPWEQRNLRSLEAVPYQEPPWGKRYPELARPMRNYKWPENNQFLANIAAAAAAYPGGFTAFRQIIPNDVNISDSNLVWNPSGPVMVECRVVGRDEAPNKLLWELWQKEGFDLKSVVADPKFANPNNNDYQLRDDSPAYRLGFQKISLERIGLYQNELRASWPVPKDARPPMSLARVASQAAAAPLARAKSGAVVTVPRAANAPTIDGKIDPREWSGATGIVLQSDETGNPAALKSFASLMYDNDFLYVALLNHVDPNHRLSVTGHWGADDAAEVAIRNPLNRIPNIILVRGYPTGQNVSSTKAGCSPEVASRVGELTQYEAHQIDAGRWSCEWALPWVALRYDLAQHNQFDFNITVRKAASKLWLMWQPTGGEGWALDKAGAILVSK